MNMKKWKVSCLDVPPSTAENAILATVEGSLQDQKASKRDQDTSKQFKTFHKLGPAHADPHLLADRQLSTSARKPVTHGTVLYQSKNKQLNHLCQLQ